jgi:transposase InsO family protein
LRQVFPKVGLGRLCALFGVSRQAYYEARINDRKSTIANCLILCFVKEYRNEIPLVGTRKLYHLITPHLQIHGIKMGRDKLFDLLRFHCLLVRRRRRMVKTTDSHHWLKKYPNLTKEIVVTGIEQLWVSDITYVRTLQGFAYLSLITDAYSRKIVGYSLYPTLEANGCIEALQMAIADRTHESPYNLIHHSDRGIQYCSAMYIELLRGENIDISMTQSGSPYENALAERVNGIIKNEFYSKSIYQNYKEAKKRIAKNVTSYNSIRPHSSVNFLTPDQAHITAGELKKRWKKYPFKNKIRKEVEFSEASAERIIS